MDHDDPLSPQPPPRFDVLVEAVQELSLVRVVEDVQRIVRTAARTLAGADGATFVLRDGEQCFYADEDAIAPLWKGRRFPLEACISGWAMLHGESVVIPDIYVDERIPHEAYRPTFVQSLAMVPIRQLDPLGAIGVYWADHREPTRTELTLLQALADTTAVALEIVSRREREQVARVLSLTDELTGTLNRRGWEMSLAAALASAEPFAIALLDVDLLKEVNDTRGHHAGDEVLRAAAAEWRGCLRPDDVIARLGGDEFAVLLAHCDPDQARAIGERLAEARPEGTTCSVGVAAWTTGEGPKDLVARADRALYEAKRAGRARAAVAA